MKAASGSKLALERIAKTAKGQWAQTFCFH